MRAGMMPDLANMAAQESSTETVPIRMTTSRIRSSSAEPVGKRSVSRNLWIFKHQMLNAWSLILPAAAPFSGKRDQNLNHFYLLNSRFAFSVLEPPAFILEEWRRKSRE